MRINKITIQNFRNIGFADLALAGTQQFFVGENAQGKTNLLEAAGLLSALRSFRTSDEKALIMHGQAEAAIACEVEHERLGTSRVIVKLKRGGKEVICDGERIKRLGDFLGRFPTVVFSSQDQQLVRGSPGTRRRWLDLVLAETDADYLRALQQYHQALAERNQLLKRGTANDAELTAFEKPLAEAAAVLVDCRTAGVEVLGNLVQAAYAGIADTGDEKTEPAGLRYVADAGSRGQTASEWADFFAQGRTRDLVMRTTLGGPHRDDCELAIANRAAREYASEGQQRSLAIAMRLAELNFLRERVGIQPVLLADDVLGELDEGRRRRFWKCLENDLQVIATGTCPPDAELGTWQMWCVKAGTFENH